MRKIIIASHGDMSKGILNSAKMILGEVEEEVETFSLYPGESPADYSHTAEIEILNNKDKEFVFITDIKGGSVYNALFQLAKYPNVKLFSGMNLNLLLDIILAGSNNIDKSKSIELINSAKEGITYTILEELEKFKEEDF